ncbi:MAG: asparagine synthase (glutamine-hydrolyzing) [Alphaproteobacteria bacterium]|nr:asparagine synthase (glutamine-hydrolyzing) [Alphaproteobacteria bacterium]
MCGITGLFGPPGEGAALESLAQAMAQRIAHRGPDAACAWADGAAGVAFGHRRLAIVDLTETGLQPMRSASGRYVICYNGEVYNFCDLRAELEPLGHRFRGHSDTEVMLAAIEQWGLVPAVNRLNGMFAFALWDAVERRLHLVRDRFGVKPLLYGRHRGRLVFASEAWAFKALEGFAPSVDREAVALYLLRGCIPGGKAIFEGFAKLAPGHILTASAPDRWEIAPYWKLADVARAGLADPWTGSRGEAIDALEALLADSVARRMIADVPLGVFLSGGVDSSTVAALMKKTGQPVKTYTIGFTVDAYNEADHARAVAAHLGTQHTELMVSPEEAMAAIPLMGPSYDEPFADSSQLPTYLVSRMARHHVTVCLTGDGGDEMFGGYTRYFWARDIARFGGAVPWPAVQALGHVIAAVPPGAYDSVLGALAPILPRALRQRDVGDKLHKLAALLRTDGIAAMYRSLVSLYPDPAAIVADRRRPLDPLLAVEREAPDADLVRRMMYLDAVTYMNDDILTKVDRASMAVSLEAREPLLDYRLAALAWRLPLDLKVAGGRGKIALREVLYRHVPQALIERPKWGFGVPIHEWLRGPMRDWAEGLLDAARLRADGFFDPVPIRVLWDEHLSGRRNWQHRLWAILMFQSWREAWARG